jgi:hypothetical protein
MHTLTCMLRAGATAAVRCSAEGDGFGRRGSACALQTVLGLALQQSRLESRSRQTHTSISAKPLHPTPQPARDFRIAILARASFDPPQPEAHSCFLPPSILFTSLASRASKRLTGPTRSVDSPLQSGYRYQGKQDALRYVSKPISLPALLALGRKPRSRRSSGQAAPHPTNNNNIRLLIAI